LSHQFKKHRPSNPGTGAGLNTLSIVIRRLDRDPRAR